MESVKCSLMGSDFTVPPVTNFLRCTASLSSTENVRPASPRTRAASPSITQSVHGIAQHRREAYAREHPALPSTHSTQHHPAPLRVRAAPPGSAEPGTPRRPQPRGTCERMFSWLSASSCSGSAEGPAVPAGWVPARQPAPSAARQSSSGSGRAMGGRRRGRGRGRRRAAAARSGAERRGGRGRPGLPPRSSSFPPSGSALPPLLPPLLSRCFPLRRRARAAGGSSPQPQPAARAPRAPRASTGPEQAAGSPGTRGCSGEPPATSPKGPRCRSAPGEPEHPTPAVCQGAGADGEPSSRPVWLLSQLQEQPGSHPPSFGWQGSSPDGMAWHGTPQLSLALPTLRSNKQHIPRKAPSHECGPLCAD